MAADLKVGDRVRVTIEGAVSRVWAEGSPTDLGLTVRFDSTFGEHILTHGSVKRGSVVVEKIEPPVKEFGPGDTVSHLRSGVLISLGGEGFFNHEQGKFFPWGHFSDALGKSLDREHFTSVNYERVELG